MQIIQLQRDTEILSVKAWCKSL